MGGLRGAPGVLLLVHLGAFGAAAIACFASVRRARRVADPDTRRGLVALLVASGVWASSHVLFLAVPVTEARVAFYQVGLVSGLSTVGAWLYFCSAYTGRSVHRNPTWRRLAVAVFLVVVAVKVTSPVTGLYFTTERVVDPFAYLAVEHGVVHWLVMGLAYALATAGYFMLVEAFVQADYDARPFVALVGVTAVPAVLDILGAVRPYLLELTYEPLGVAAFAVGVTFVYADRFQEPQVTHGYGVPVLAVSGSDRLRDYNELAADHFPEALTRAAIGADLSAVLPGVADALDDTDGVVAHERDGETRYYQVRTRSFGASQTNLGRLVTLRDVTEREQYRSELERQNERLEAFLGTVSHDLRNPLNVAQARVELARDECESDDLATAARAHQRMSDIIDDLLTLARQNGPLEDVGPVDVGSLARHSWELVETGEARLVVETDLRVRADADRLQHLFENLFRNAVEHGPETTGPDPDRNGVTVTVGELDDATGFYVADDGPGIPEDERDSVFESGYSTDDNGTGFGLAIVSGIVEAHGWTVRVTESAGGGARFEVTVEDTADA